MDLHLIAWIIAGTCAFLSLVVISYIILNHMVNYHTPQIQRPMVRILLMVPIYGIDSFLALLWTDYALYFDLGRDCYEAYALYTFFKLLEAFVGGQHALIDKLEAKPRVKHPMPLSWCGVSFKPGTLFLHRTSKMMLQFVILRPLCSVTAIVLHFFHLYGEGSFSPTTGYLYLTMINNVSVTLALYYLVLFYNALAEDLKPYSPVMKFLAVKAVIFFAFWQGVAIALLAYFEILKGTGEFTTADVSRGLQDFLISVEMLPMAFVFAYAFGPRSFQQDGSSVHLLEDMKGMGNVVKNYQVFTQNFNPIVQNFADVIDMRDVLGDTYQTFAQTARKHVVVNDFLKISVEEQLSRVLKRGWLYKRGLAIHKWRKRYFLLINNPVGLLYYERNPFDDDDIVKKEKKPKDLIKKVVIKKERKTEERPLPVGFIDFATAVEIRDEIQKSLWTFWDVEHSFCVQTKSRPWMLKGKTVEETESWLASSRHALSLVAAGAEHAKVWEISAGDREDQILVHAQDGSHVTLDLGQAPAELGQGWQAKERSGDLEYYAEAPPAIEGEFEGVELEDRSVGYPSTISPRPAGYEEIGTP